MEFYERTKFALADAVKELMKTTPLDKISVSEIVAECGTTRQTFYRNFKDKYDLVNWYFDNIVQKTIRKMGLSLTIEEGLIKKLEPMKGERYFLCLPFHLRTTTVCCITIMSVFISSSKKRLEQKDRWRKI